MALRTKSNLLHSGAELAYTTLRSAMAIAAGAFAVEVIGVIGGDIAALDRAANGLAKGGGVTV